MRGKNGTTLEGTIDRVIFHNETDGYCVFQLNNGGYRSVKVVGYTPVAREGERIRATGAWDDAGRYGRQFVAEILEVCPPDTVDGITAYLSSGMVKGIGPVTAKKLVDSFGADIFDVIEKTPERLKECSGLGPKRIERIVSRWQSQKAVREIMVFLYSHGISTSIATKIYKRYHKDAMSVITKNPYRLAKEVRGIGFKTADRIAQDLGVDPLSPFRARAGVVYALSEASARQGHCCLPKGDLIELANELLEVPEELLDEAIEHEVSDGQLRIDGCPKNDSVYQRSLYECECELAWNLRGLRRGALPWGIVSPTKLLSGAEKRLGLELADSQKEAVQKALQSKVMVITGGPGVGKTTVVKAIIAAISGKDVRITLCAPTGRAAKRMQETSGMEAKTIHRLLEHDPEGKGFRRNEDNHLDCDLLIVDECSMIDIPLANSLVKAIPEDAAVIFVGDVDQLPSVGPGAFLSDLIASNTVPVIRLTEIFRQASTSWIIRIAHQVNQGVHPRFPKEKGDCQFIVVEDKETLADRIVTLVSEEIPKQLKIKPQDIQVLCPMRRGNVGTVLLNEQLQQTLNPQDKVLLKFGTRFGKGDKVMQIVNNYKKGVFNGDVGYVSDIDFEDEVVTVIFDGHAVEYPSEDLDELVLSYATTIHKSQGSEYPVVVMPVTMQHYVMLKRNLIYTGITRGRKLVVLVGEPKALMMAVKDYKSVKRNSGFEERLRELSTNHFDFI